MRPPNGTPQARTRRPITRPQPSDPKLTRRNVEALRRHQFDHIPT